MGGKRWRETWRGRITTLKVEGTSKGKEKKKDKTRESGDGLSLER